MELFINGESVNTAESAASNMAGLINQLVGEGKIAPRQVVARILLDSEEAQVPADGLAAMEVTPGARVDLTIREPEDLLRPMLEDGIQFCDAVVGHCGRVAAQYRTDTVDVASQEMVKLLDSFRVFTRFMQQIRVFIKGHFDVEECFNDSLEHYARTMNDLMVAQEGEDWLHLADLLEYEFRDVFEKFVMAMDCQWKLVAPQKDA